MIVAGVVSRTDFPLSKHVLICLDYDLHRCRVHYHPEPHKETIVLHAIVARILRLNKTILFRVHATPHDNFYVTTGVKFTVNSRSRWQVELTNLAKQPSRAVSVKDMPIIKETYLIHSAFQYLVLIENKGNPKC